jgi:alkylated DNA repair dioxygenase AlkB
MGSNLDLFVTGPALETLDLPDGALRFASGFYDQEQADSHLQALLTQIDWRQEYLRIAGKAVAQPRLTAWYGDPGSTYSYSGLQLAPQAWTPLLEQLKADVEAASSRRYNSVLLNLYRDENDSVGWHSDNEPELGPEPAIASLSFGATRSFKLRHKKRKELHTIALPLSHGSLLLMEGATQRHWLHAVEKQKQPTGPRVNLTFRWITPVR